VRLLLLGCLLHQVVWQEQVLFVWVCPLHQLQAKAAPHAVDVLGDTSDAKDVGATLQERTCVNEQAGKGEGVIKG